MARSSVTLDESISQRLDSWQVHEDRRIIWEIVESPAAEEAQHLWVTLAHSIDELGSNPSRAAVIRQAVEYYLNAVREARRLAELETGYAALAQDEERASVIRAMRNRVPDRFRED